MATTIDLTWYPDPAHVGGWVTFIVTLAPTPPAGAHVWIHVDGVSLGQLEILPGGDQISTYWSAPSAGKYLVVAGFANLPVNFGDPTDSDSTQPADLVVLAGPGPDPLPQPTHGLAPEPADDQSPLPGDAGARIQSGSNASNGVSNVDPFTGAPATDPYTGEPLSARDASINDRIKAVYSQPDAVPESTRYAILDFYSKPGIDLTGVPQSIQNSIFDIFSQAAEPPLPGLGLDEFLGYTFSSVLGDISSRLVGTASTAIDVVNPLNPEPFVLDAMGQTLRTLRPIFGAAQAIGGVAEIYWGVVIAVGSEGLGAGLGVALAAHGLDQLIAGGRTMLGEDAQSLTQYILTDALRPSCGSNAPLVAGVLDGAISLGLNSATEFGEIGEIGLRSLSTEAAATRIELSQSTQLGDVKSIVAPTAEMATEGSEIPRSQIAFISSEWSAGAKAEQMVGVVESMEGKYIGRELVTADNPGANYQISVTGSNMEYVFKTTINGKTEILKVDGVVNGFLVEAKEGNMGYFFKWKEDTWEYDMVDQARRYLIVNDLFAYKGVFYAVSDADKVQGLIEMFTFWFPDAMNSGKLQVQWVPKP